jgi:glucokinase
MTATLFSPLTAGDHLILVIDCGATKIKLAIARRVKNVKNRRPGDQQYELHHIEVLNTDKFDSLAQAVEYYLSRLDLPVHPRCAVCGIAAPVDDNRCEDSVNLPKRWMPLSGADVSKRLGFPFELGNDTLIYMYGLMPGVSDLGSLVSINGGIPLKLGPLLVLTIGTGVGQGLLVATGKNGTSWLPIVGEGSHCHQSPIGPEQSGLVTHFEGQPANEGKYACPDVLCSGGGLRHVFDFLLSKLRERQGGGSPALLLEGPERALFQQLEQSGVNPIEVILGRGLDGSSDLCKAAVRMWANLVGTHAANVSIASFAGVVVGGGMARRIYETGRHQTGLYGTWFIEGFTNMGHDSNRMKALPVCLDPHSEERALLGAARMGDDTPEYRELVEIPH